MEKINRNNYELFFVDYFDGKLNHHQVADLMLFLAQNPDLDKEFNEYRHITLESENISFNDKNSLLKDENSITGSISDDTLISLLENDLQPKDKYLLTQEINNNTDLAKDYKLYSLTKLTPDYSIKYQDKDALKKQLKIYPAQRNLQIYSYAASILILFLFSFLIYNYNSSPDNNTQNTVIYADANKKTPVKPAKAVRIVRKETPAIVAPVIKKKKNIAEIIPTEKAKTITISKLENTPVLKQKTQNNEFMAFVNSLNNKLSQYIEEDNSSDNYSTEELADAETNTTDNNTVVITENSKPKSGFWAVVGNGISLLSGNKIKAKYNEKGRVQKLVINDDRFRIVKRIK